MEDSLRGYEKRINKTIDCILQDSLSIKTVDSERKGLKILKGLIEAYDRCLEIGINVNYLNKEASMPKHLRVGKVNPNYYQDSNGKYDLLTHLNQILPIDYMRGFYICCIFKYIKRYRKKNGIEDLKKAETYLTRLIQLESERSESR